MSALGRRLTKSTIWGALYFFGVSAGLFAVFNSWAFDDPFITYRYAENLASGLGFVYNPGEAVLSTTTPLFALLLAGLAPLGIAIPKLANLIGAAGLAAGGLLMGDIARKLGQTPIQRAGAAWIGRLLYPAFPLLVSTIGSETPLYLAFCLAAIAAYLHRRLALAGALLGLAVLTRADALILVGIVGLAWLVNPRRAPRPWSALTTFSLVLLPWLIYGWRTFGSPVPATLLVKQSQNLLPGSPGFLNGLWELLGVFGQLPHYWALAGLSSIGLYCAIRRPAGKLFFFAWPFAHAGAYAMLGVTSNFWYYAPMVPGLLLSAGFGLGDLSARLPKPGVPWDVRPPRWARVHPIAAALIALFLLGGQLADLNRMARQPDDRYAAYRAVGEWFAENTAEDTSIGVLEVGIVGYFAGPRPMIDFGGLIRPEVAAQFGPDFSFPQAALWTAERYQPDYLVVTEGRYRELLQQFTVVRCVQAAYFYGADYGLPKDIVLYLC